MSLLNRRIWEGYADAEEIWSRISVQLCFFSIKAKLGIPFATRSPPERIWLTQLFAMQLFDQFAAYIHVLYICIANFKRNSLALDPNEYDLEIPEVLQASASNQFFNSALQISASDQSCRLEQSAFGRDMIGLPSSTQNTGKATPILQLACHPGRSTKFRSQKAAEKTERIAIYLQKSLIIWKYFH